MRSSLNFNHCNIKNINIDQSEKKYEINVLILHTGKQDIVDIHQHFNSTVGNVRGMQKQGGNDD